MFLYLLVGMCLAYEIHKMFDFKNFSRFTYIIYHYAEEVKRRKGKVYNTIVKMSFANLGYVAVLIIGLFGSQGLFFGSILVLSILTGNILKKTNRKVSSIIYLIDSILSMIILTLILVNFYFFKMESIEFIKHLISLV